MDTRKIFVSISLLGIGPIFVSWLNIKTYVFTAIVALIIGLMIVAVAAMFLNFLIFCFSEVNEHNEKYLLHRYLRQCSGFITVIVTVIW